MFFFGTNARSVIEQMCLRFLKDSDSFDCITIFEIDKDTRKYNNILPHLDSKLNAVLPFYIFPFISVF